MKSFANFRNAAAFFAIRAKTSKNADGKKRLVENALFYDRLASITPTFPPGYKEPGIGNGSRLRHRAEECRTMAECFKDQSCRRRLIALAEDYERLARQRENAQQTGRE